MKFVVFILCLFVVLCRSDQSSINFNAHEKECTKELYGDGIEIKYFNRRYLPENNDIVSNIVKCSWKKDGLINEFDEIVYDNLKIFIINEYRTAGECSYYLALLVSGDAYNNCKDMLGESSGEVAVKIINCILRRIDSY